MNTTTPETTVTAPAARTAYICTDGNADVEIVADSAAEAAQEYVDGGDWGDATETSWVTIYVTRDMSDVAATLVSLIGEHEHSDHRTGWWVYAAADIDLDALRSALPGCTLRLDDDGDLDVDHGEERESHTIAIDPREPACEPGKEHDWQSPIELVGGLDENPGVHGHGGGVYITEICAHCGRKKITDTWAQDRQTGEQGLCGVSYEDATDESLTWARVNSDDAVVVAESAGEFSTKQIIRVGDDWFSRTANGGARGSHSTGGNRFPSTLGPAESIGWLDAKRLMLDWGMDDAEIAKIVE